MRDHNAGIFTYSDMICTVWSMMIAAADTTSEGTTLLWLNMARFPSWQQKIYEAARYFHVDAFSPYNLQGEKFFCRAIRRHPTGGCIHP